MGLADPTKTQIRNGVKWTIFYRDAVNRQESIEGTTSDAAKRVAELITQKAIVHEVKQNGRRMLGTDARALMEEAHAFLRKPNRTLPALHHT